MKHLTGGEVNGVTGPDGNMYMLAHDQNQLRSAEATRLGTILDALAVNVALLDAGGVIILVNDAWRRFEGVSAAFAPGHEIGINYIAICEKETGDKAAEARKAAEGIRSVMKGELKSFSLEYTCHSPTEKRWLVMRVRPLGDDGQQGVVVLHQDVTEERQTQESLQASELRFRQMAENIRDMFFLMDADSSRMLYVSPAYEDIYGRSCESVYADPESWMRAIHPDDLASTYEKYEQGMAGGSFDFEYRMVRPDGSIRWLRAHGYPVVDDAGTVVRVTGVVADITERKRMTAALTRNEERFRVLYEASPDAIMLVSPEEGFLTGNRATLSLFGCRDEQEFTALSPAATSPEFQPDGRKSADKAQEMMHLAAEKGSHLFEWLHQRRDGTTFFADVLLVATTIDDKSVIQGTVRNITERKQTEEKIRRLNRVYAVLSGIYALIVRVRNRGELCREACRIAIEEGGLRVAWIGGVDRSAMKIVPFASAGADVELLDVIWERSSLNAHPLTGYSPPAIAVREKRAVIVNNVENNPLVHYLRLHIDRGVRSFVVLPLLVADEPVALLGLHAAEAGFFDEAEMNLLTQLAGNIAFAIDHIEKQERLDYLAHYDVLTGLANRSLFLERVTQCMRSAVSGGHKLAVFLIDIERFKNINDSLGQPAGDALLVQVAEWLTDHVEDASQIARVGADLFAVMLPQVEEASDVERRLEEMMTAFLDHLFPLADAVFRIATKVGVTLFPDDGADAETLFKNAEAALKKSKATGDRYLFYTRPMTGRVVRGLALENQLRRGFDNGEFVLHYQPKVNLISGKVTGAEALIRWNDPLTGLMPPGHFIPILEEIGLIGEVGRWALRKGLEDYLRWRSAGLNAVRIAVNVSPLQLRHRDFIADVARVIAIDAHAADGLELEITESLIMADIQHSISSLKAIRALGVKIAIDDFGTGFSSLSYLSKLPVDTLKIDRSFVREMTIGPRGLALVSTIIKLAHALELRVVAEGVETEEESRLLTLLYCEEMQGFLFSKPVPADIFKEKFLVPAPGA